jgi:hypothetical protein
LFCCFCFSVVLRSATRALLLCEQLLCRLVLGELLLLLCWLLPAVLDELLLIWLAILALLLLEQVCSLLRYLCFASRVPSAKSIFHPCCAPS